MFIFSLANAHSAHLLPPASMACLLALIGDQIKSFSIESFSWMIWFFS